MPKHHKAAPIDKYALITDQICTLLEQGIKPWRKPWKAGYDRIPFQNLVTRHVYTGSNPLWCAVSNLTTGHDSPFFITFKQATEQGWQVKKGSKSAWIRFAGIGEKEVENEAGELTKERIHFAKFSSIFSIDCIDDSESHKKIADFVQELADDTPDNPDEKILTIDQFIADTKAVITYGGNRACYSPNFDRIKLPAFEKFSSARRAYATAIHELGHWTGHESRLDREGMKSNSHGDEIYAFEELVAELASAFVCDKLFPEYMAEDLEHHANYLGSWLTGLKHDDQAFFKAVSQAQKAANYLVELSGKPKLVSSPMTTNLVIPESIAA